MARYYSIRTSLRQIQIFTSLHEIKVFNFRTYAVDMSEA